MSFNARLKTSALSSVILFATIGLVACGGSGSSSDSKSELTELVDSSAATQPAGASEPKVVLPKETPTKLVITDISPGTGDGAASGDTLAMFYVGVLSADGTRFDGNFGAEPFIFTLGQGNVIEGWDKGLIGIKVGGRRQLDIPSDLAYGEQGAGDVIKPNSALSFIVEASSIIPASKPEDAPKVTVVGASARSDLKIDDLRKGSGDEVKKGAKIAVQIVSFRADTGAELTNSWTTLTPITLALIDEQNIPGLIKGLPGMKVGGRRKLTIPFMDVFGGAANDDLGLPANTDLVVIVDVIAIL